MKGLYSIILMSSTYPINFCDIFYCIFWYFVVLFDFHIYCIFHLKIWYLSIFPLIPFHSIALFSLPFIQFHFISFYSIFSQPNRRLFHICFCCSIFTAWSISRSSHDHVSSFIPTPPLLNVRLLKVSLWQFSLNLDPFNIVF